MLPCLWASRSSVGTERDGEEFSFVLAWISASETLCQKALLASPQRCQGVVLAGGSSLQLSLQSGKQSEKIADGDHMKVGCLTASCNCEQVDKYSDCDHMTVVILHPLL